MTEEQLNAIFDRVRSWPQSRQEDAANLLLAMEAQQAEPYPLSAEERADIQEALAELTRAEIATDAEAASVFDRGPTPQGGPRD